jgi:mRNA interferase MazF
MKRGDIFLAAVSGDYGKPRPTVVVQNDKANETHASIVVCPMTSDVIPVSIFRLTIEPNEKNGLRAVSQIMVDKIVAVRRERLKEKIGHISMAQLTELSRALAVWLGF